MTEKVVYVAADGREFDSKDECEKYEARMLEMMDKMMFDYHAFIDDCNSGRF